MNTRRAVVANNQRGIREKARRRIQGGMRCEDSENNFFVDENTLPLFPHLGEKNEEGNKPSRR